VVYPCSWGDIGEEGLKECSVIVTRYLFSFNRPKFIPSVSKSRSLPIPMIIGSVVEAQGARHRRISRELHPACDKDTGEEAPAPGMVRSSVIDDNREWLVPPSSYQDGLRDEKHIV
jgi:hypothetical protein